MITFLILGIALMIFALLLIISPGTVVKIERQASRVYVTNPKILKYRFVVGVFLILSASYMIYIYFAS